MILRQRFAVDAWKVPRKKLESGQRFSFGTPQPSKFFDITPMALKGDHQGVMRGTLRCIQCIRMLRVMPSRW